MDGKSVLAAQSNDITRIRAMMKRYKKIRISYFNNKRGFVTEEYSDFIAQVTM